MLAETQRAVIRQHINHLCDLYQLDRLYVSSLEAVQVWVNESMIWLPELTGPLSYYVSMHEIGHFATHHRSKDQLEKEAHAWNWAFEMGKVGVTKPVYRRAADFLRRHRKQYDGVPPKLFIDLLETVEQRI
jgi:hypothetical protein